MKAAKLVDKRKSEFELVDLDIPQPKENEVRIKVMYVSPNAADYRSIKMGMVPKHKILGSAISGVVEALGNKVKHISIGENVLVDLADSGFGGFSELICVDYKLVVKKLDNVSHAEASTLPVAATTALKALKKGDIKSNHRVLILGSSGGVGIFALQLVKHYGAHVTAVCSARNVEQTKKLGADIVIDYNSVDVLNSNDKYDLILAINGNYPLLKSKRALSSNGRYVAVGGSLSQIFKALIFGRILSIGKKKVRVAAGKGQPEDLAYVLDLLAKKHIKTIIEQEFNLSTVTEAMQNLAEGHAKAKITVLCEEARQIQ